MNHRYFEMKSESFGKDEWLIFNLSEQEKDMLVQCCPKSTLVFNVL